jgi:rhamnosyltransferase
VSAPEPPRPDAVAAVVVSYFPDEGFADRIARVAAQVCRVIVVDNGSSGAPRERLDGLAREGRIELVALGENLGLGAALNRGLERALDAGLEWALTLDQDTTPRDGMIAGLARVYEDFPGRDRVGIIGANYEERGTGTTAFRRRAAPAGSFAVVDEVITSGSLVSLRAFVAVGPFREDLFIYYVDHEFCKRVRDAGYLVLLTRDVLMIHATGSASRRRVLFREVVTHDYPAWRNYYIVRNAVAIASEQAFSDPRWAAYRLWVLAKRSTSTLLLEQGRLEKLAYMARGLRDGILGRLGKRVP